MSKYIPSMEVGEYEAYKRREKVRGLCLLNILIIITFIR